MSSVNVDDICQKLKENDRHKQIAALRELETFCQNKANSSQELVTLFDECYLHLLNCYSTRYESVREHAVDTVTTFLNHFPANDFHVFNVISTIKMRMGKAETIESCENIRQLYIEQLHLVIRGYKESKRGHVLRDCYEDLVIILSKALSDDFPVVQREACACVATLAESADSYYFQNNAAVLAKATYRVLNHKHSQSRIVAIRALAQLALHMTASGDNLSRLIMEVSPLLMDSMPLVRLECGKLGVKLILDLKDRYSYFDRLIPLVLCCLMDTGEVHDTIKPLWEKCGQQYYEENEEELKKQELADVKPPNYPVGVERPTIGCRALVQRSLRLLKLIVREMSDWQDKVRTHTMRLLYQFVLHAENAMTAKFFEIYPDVAYVCQDPDLSVSSTAIKVADLMGRLFTYSDWFEHGFEGLEKYVKVGYVKCFYHMFEPVINPDMNDLLRVTDLIKKPDYSQSLKREMQVSVYNIVKNIYGRCLSFPMTESESFEAHLEDLYKNIYIIIMKIMAIAMDIDGKENRSERIDNCEIMLKKIASQQGLKYGQLHEKYFSLALDYVQNLDTELDINCEPIILLDGLIKIAKFRPAYLKPLQQKINEVFENCADCAKVKIFTCIAATMLTWSETIDRNTTESAEMLEKFLLSVVDPHLGWRAGASAEVMRTLAISTLCAVSQGAVAEAKFVFPLFAKYFTNLLEDRAVSTRRYTVQCLLNFCELPIEELKPIAYGILSRLDDPSSETRILAVKVIVKLKIKIDTNEENAKFDREIWESFIKYAFNILFLHYECPEIRLKETIKQTLKELSKLYPTICEDSYKRALALSGPASDLNNLKDDLYDAYSE